MDYHMHRGFHAQLESHNFSHSLSDQLYESSTKHNLHKILLSMQRAKILTLRDELFVDVNYTPFLNHMHSLLNVSSSIKKLKF